MGQRAKKVVTTAPDEAGAHEALRIFAETSSKLKGLEAEVEQEVQRIREKHNVKLQKLRVDYNHNMEQLQAYAEANKETLFTKKKSVEWMHGIIGFRTSTPSVIKPSRLTWPKVLEILKEDKLTSFIRTKEEINKDKMIESREDKIIMGRLKDLAGIEVIQKETFFVEPKEEEL